jgi:uncharacterized membrane protein
MIRIAPRHGRFLIAFGFGTAVALAAWVQHVTPVFCLLSGVNAFFLLYLALMAAMIGSSTPEALRRHAAQADEGVALILLLALLAVVVSVTAIFLVLNATDTRFAARAAAMISLPLGWTTVHVLAAFHYAHAYYRLAQRGLVFPGKAEPGAWDFLYFSFTIGMTAQVSDVVADTPAMRKTILAHAVASFFYNTGILALAVNAVVTAGG